MSQQSIPPDVYDRDYFLSEICEGFEEAQQGEISYNKAKQVRILGARPGLRILDAGCGRGETVLACARAGAQVAGIDYSDAAVELTREMLAEIQPEADIVVGSVTALPWPDNSFDRVQFSDVIEHLDPPQTVPALREFHRVLRPGGYLLVHTAPNLLFMKYGWPAARPFVRLAGHREIADRVDHWFEIAEDYHVNEQSVHTLRRAMREAGFADPHVWIDPDVLRGGRFHLLSGFEGPLVKAAKRIAALRPVRLFLGNDVLGVGVK
ncbi:MAG TPA: methyltransferase domain-containing protein [Solirubrobacterales bacterium]|nr:methyltransferase domain-containing protein [Solirubrobacterales bacterium]